VPTYRDRRNDRRAIETLQKLLPDRKVIGVDCVELIWGLGAIHCLTQQQPKAIDPGPASSVAGEKNRAIR
jgi:agmatine deiminase